MTSHNSTPALPEKMRSTDFPDCFYRVSIKGLCVRDGKLLLERESAEVHSGKWELPGGGLDFGEDIHTGFKREVTEEMGLTVTKMAKHPTYIWTPRFDNKRKMAWFYSCVLAYRIEFKDLHFTPSDECLEIRFFSKEELQTLPLNTQAKKIAELFDPKDFEGDF
jgi:8-oxo-dGTP diphosphatase